MRTKTPELTLDNILKMDTMELANLVFEMFHVDMPQYVETADEMNRAQSIISRSVSNYAYLDSMSQLLKITKRNRKREGADKNELDDILSKEEVFAKMAEHCKTTYAATSRQITIRQLVLDELHMSDSRGMQK